MSKVWTRRRLRTHVLCACVKLTAYEFRFIFYFYSKIIMIIYQKFISIILCEWKKEYIFGCTKIRVDQTVTRWTFGA